MHSNFISSAYAFRSNSHRKHYITCTYQVQVALQKGFLVSTLDGFFWGTTGKSIACAHDWGSQFGPVSLESALQEHEEISNAEWYMWYMRPYPTHTNRVLLIRALSAMYQHIQKVGNQGFVTPHSKKIVFDARRWPCNECCAGPYGP